MVVAEYKAEWIVCTSCCCVNEYLIWPPNTCCLAELQVCLCVGGDVAFPAHETVPVLCTLLPCCVVYPKFDCCATPRHLKVDNLDSLGKKADFLVCVGTCCFCCATNRYCFAPYTCCADDSSQMLCIGSDCAFPLSNSVPKALALCGLMCYPRVNCCIRTANEFMHAR
uniref:Uncharacterized protein n=1 Tax=Pinguiococcus pyrenoidosus TaxID=172671 RepID=A0A7R9YBV2_9STRA